METMHHTFLLASAVFFMSVVGVTANADTVVEKTVVTQKELPDVEKIDFSAFDLNGDDILSMSEVGEKLFYTFDTDGNEVIDNIEFNHKQVMTIIPMEKRVFKFVDYDDDGRTDQSSYTYEEFIEQSMLMRFDENMDGLSPADFIKMSFLALDDDKSSVIELEEWKEEYLSTVLPHNEPERYN